jgi:hypothetical protein
VERGLLDEGTAPGEGDGEWVAVRVGVVGVLELVSDVVAVVVVVVVVVVLVSKIQNKYYYSLSLFS